MGIDAVALLHCTKPKLLKKLASSKRIGEGYKEQLERVMECAKRGEKPPLIVSLTVLGVGDDVARLFTGVRFAQLQADPVFAQMLASRIAEILPPGAHEETQLLFYPDVAEPSAKTYAAVLAELDGGCVAASIEPISDEARSAWDEAQARKLTEVEVAETPISNEEFFKGRMQAAGEAFRSQLDELGVFSPKEGDHTISGLEINMLDGGKKVLPPISLENAMKLLHPDIRPKSLEPEDMADANARLLERMRKVGDPKQVKEWERLLTPPGEDPPRASRKKKAKQTKT